MTNLAPLLRLRKALEIGVMRPEDAPA